MKTRDWARHRKATSAAWLNVHDMSVKWPAKDSHACAHKLVPLSALAGGASLCSGQQLLLSYNWSALRIRDSDN